MFWKDAWWLKGPLLIFIDLQWLIRIMAGFVNIWRATCELWPHPRPFSLISLSACVCSHWVIAFVFDWLTCAPVPLHRRISYVCAPILSSDKLAPPLPSDRTSQAHAHQFLWLNFRCKACAHGKNPIITDC